MEEWSPESHLGAIDRLAHKEEPPLGKYARAITMTWTPDTIQALAKGANEEADAIEVEATCSTSDELAQMLRQLASALTWALERIKEAEAERDTYRDMDRQSTKRNRELIAERDAANARAESARNDALEEAANKVPSNWLHPAMKHIPSDTPITCADIERCLQDVAAGIRALKEAGK